jgi:hypothetical protein
VKVHPGSPAIKAEIVVNSKLLSVNAREVLHLTHNETLKAISSASRPLLLRYVLSNVFAICLGFNT